MSPNATKAALRVRQLRKTYKDVVAVNGLDLEVRPGECFGLLGPNGAGKTTTIEICEGLTPADSGEVEVLGLHWATGAKALRQRLGIQLQETQLSDKLTVLETIDLFRSFFQQGPGGMEVIGLVQLEEKAKSRVGNLSGWPARWWAIPIFCSSTSRPPDSTRRPAGSCGNSSRNSSCRDGRFC
jgi:ABC-2 type transport system ATP-binding protein